jgi:hypothetical protein
MMDDKTYLVALARAAVAEPDWCNCTLASGEIDFNRLRSHVVDALRAAYAAGVQAERERCAALCTAFADEGAAASEWLSEWTDYETIKAARHLAGLILAAPDAG